MEMSRGRTRLLVTRCHIQEDSSGCGRWWVWQSRTWDSVEPQEQLRKSKLPHSHLVETPPHHYGPQLESCTALQVSNPLLCVCTSLQHNEVRILSLVDFTRLANCVYPAKRLSKILQTFKLTTCQVNDSCVMMKFWYWNCWKFSKETLWGILLAGIVLWQCPSFSCQAFTSTIF